MNLEELHNFIVVACLANFHRGSMLQSGKILELDLGFLTQGELVNIEASPNLTQGALVHYCEYVNEAK